MLQVNDVSYAIGDRQILDSVSFSLMPGEKAALVGANGAGKTTLVKIIVGELVEDEGTVCKPNSISYVPQIITDDVLVQMHGTVKEFMLEGRNLNQLFATMNETATALSSPNISEEETKRAMRRYSNAQEEFCLRCGYEAEAEIETILHGVGIAIDINRPVTTLSGGEKTRLAFARAIFADGDLLVLDEPTNHIDWQYYGWLGEYLSQTKKTVLVVSHHPEFINPFTKKIVEIERVTGRAREYNGTYSDYVEQSKVNEESLTRQVEWLRKEIERLIEAARKIQSAGPSRGRAAKNMFGRAERLKKKMDDIANELPVRGKDLRFKLSVMSRSGQVAIKATNLCKAFAKPLFAGIGFEVHRGEKVVILGPNGSGKTTLVRILMDLIQPDQGNVEFGFNVTVGYYAQEHENLDPKRTVLDEIQFSNRVQATNPRDILGRFLFPQSKVFQPVSTLSQGEKSRLSLCKLIVGGHNLVILDEPTNYLDPQSMSAVAEALQDYEGTLIFVSHDADFVRSVHPDRAIIMPFGELRTFKEELLAN